MNNNRVVITGLGTINAIAKNVQDFVRALKEGVCGILPITIFDTTNYRTNTGGEVKGFRPRDFIPYEFSIKRMSRADLMAMASTLEALRDAGLFPIPEEICQDTGVVIGGGAGGMLEVEEFFIQYIKNPGKPLKYSMIASLPCSSSADHIASRLRVMGPKTTFMTACSSGATAIGYSRDLIRAGSAKVVIAGGTEPLSRITYAAFNSLKSVDPLYCRPFDKNRQGLSLGEGSAIFILESLLHAKQRGAKIYGEVLGCGITCDSYHMTAPDPEASGAIRSMKAALDDAGISPERVDYINAHGTATPANDVMETRAIKETFGRHAYRIPVSSTKSMIGHTLGAAGAIEGLVSVLAIYHGFIPPTVHHEEPDPECDLDYVSSGSRESEISIVLSNSFAFGGNNTTLIFGKFTEKGIINE